MKVPTSCLTCSGRGMIPKYSENSAWCERCADCDGTGTRMVPFTNADRIRFMNDDELVKFIHEVYWDSYHDGVMFGRGAMRTPALWSDVGAIAEWLDEEVDI